MLHIFTMYTISKMADQEIWKKAISKATVVGIGILLLSQRLHSIFHTV